MLKLEEPEYISQYIAKLSYGTEREVVTQVNGRTKLSNSIRWMDGIVKITVVADVSKRRDNYIVRAYTHRKILEFCGLLKRLIMDTCIGWNDDDDEKSQRCYKCH